MADEGKSTLFEKLRGKKTRNINLPNESGAVDATLNDPARMIKGLENNASLRALREYAEGVTKKR
jgi:hypothetical protein